MLEFEPFFSSSSESLLSELLLELDSELLESELESDRLFGTLLVWLFIGCCPLDVVWFWTEEDIVSIRNGDKRGERKRWVEF
jgi:hypothetical protein